MKLLEIDTKTGRQKIGEISCPSGRLAIWVCV